jgi:hypothetical protein
MTPQQLRKAIEKGLRTKVPAQVAQMEREGTFSDFLAMKVEAALQEIEAIEAGPSAKALQGSSPYMEVVAALTEAQKQAEGAAIAHAIEP